MCNTTPNFRHCEPINFTQSLLFKVIIYYVCMYAKHVQVPSRSQKRHGSQGARVTGDSELGVGTKLGHFGRRASPPHYRATSSAPEQGVNLHWHFVLGPTNDAETVFPLLPRYWRLNSGPCGARQAFYLCYTAGSPNILWQGLSSVP